MPAIKTALLLLTICHTGYTTVAQQQTDTVLISGRVQLKDEVMTNLTGWATVSIKDKKVMTHTDSSGRFLLPYAPKKQAFTVIIHSIGMKPREINVPLPHQPVIDLGLTVLAAQGTDQDMIVVVGKKRKFHTFWRKITKPFRKH